MRKAPAPFLNAQKYVAMLVSPAAETCKDAVFIKALSLLHVTPYHRGRGLTVIHECLDAVVLHDGGVIGCTGRWGLVLQQLKQRPPHIPSCERYSMALRESRPCTAPQRLCLKCEFGLSTWACKRQRIEMASKVCLQHQKLARTRLQS